MDGAGVDRIGGAVAHEWESIHIEFREIAGRPPRELRYILPATSLPPQPLPCTVLRSYSARIAIGFVVGSTAQRVPHHVR